MRNRSLHAVLREFAEQAALQLAADASEGAEVPFELVESRGRGQTSLYCYRPLTAEFIRSRLGSLARLPGYGPAVQALEELEGAHAYLAARGEPRRPSRTANVLRERADAALRVFLTAIFEESTDFELVPERFDRNYAEFEAAVYQEQALLGVIVEVYGLALSSDEVPIGEGLTLLRAGALPDPPEDLAAPADAALALLTVESVAGDQSPTAAVRRRLRTLLTALRLFDEGGFALAAAGWARLDTGRWRPVPLEGAGRPPGDELVLAPESEDELRAFVNLVSRRLPERGELAWALRRFEMGCERARPLEALTDHLLAARALLEPEGPSSGRLAQRLATICAIPEERAALAERVAHAISLERAVVAGLAPAVADPKELVGALANHLRALLRDVLCGHLDSDLVAVADGLLDDQATTSSNILALSASVANR